MLMQVVILHALRPTRAHTNVCKKKKEGQSSSMEQGGNAGFFSNIGVQHYSKLNWKLPEMGPFMKTSPNRWQNGVGYEFAPEL